MVANLLAGSSLALGASAVCTHMGATGAERRYPPIGRMVDADGTEISRGELHASCNQVVHGLRALGLDKGDCVATFLPNGAPMIELYLAVTQAGWYMTPINHHLTAPEIAYILGDCEARAFFSHERFADASGGR